MDVRWKDQNSRCLSLFLNNTCIVCTNRIILRRNKVFWWWEMNICRARLCKALLSRISLNISCSSLKTWLLPPSGMVSPPRCHSTWIYQHQFWPVPRKKTMMVYIQSRIVAGWLRGVPSWKLLYMGTTFLVWDCALTWLNLNRLLKYFQ